MGENVPVEEWEWFGSAAHFICGRWCRFHLATKVGPWLVSTVGEYWPDRGVREIHAQIHDSAWLLTNGDRQGDDFDAAYMRRFGFEDIGYQRKYETMVFLAGDPCAVEGCACGLPSLASGTERDFAPANTARAATENHRALCAKWAAMPKPEAP